MNVILKPILVDTHVKISLEVLCACVPKAFESWMLAMNVKILTNVPSIPIFAGQEVLQIPIHFRHKTNFSVKSHELSFVLNIFRQVY